jgi:hypothetical protein
MATAVWLRNALRPIFGSAAAESLIVPPDF